MKNTWQHFLRRIAAGCLIGGAMAWYSAMCHAVQLANDVASNPAYDDGWTTGDNGGTGFGAWNFDGTYTTEPPGQQRMDDGLKSGGPNSSTFNDIGEAWTLFNYAFEGDNKDISQAGRSIAPLQVGETVSIVFDNPTDRLFFRGYTVRFNNGGANTCYAGDNCSTPDYDPGSVVARLAVGTFDYLDPEDDGRWYPFDEGDFHYDTETDQGARLDFTLTGPETYQLTMTPLGHLPNEPAHPPFSVSGSLQAGEMGEHVGKPIDWIEFEFYNTLTTEGFDTDFYIRSMEINSAAPPGVPGDYNSNGKVDAADYVVWREHLGTSFQLPNEVAGTTPGTVTTEDYNAWRGGFGSTLETGSGAGLVAGVVPEPGTFVYLVIAALAGTSFMARRS
jgi:hypothetical protein